MDHKRHDLPIDSAEDPFFGGFQKPQLRDQPPVYPVLQPARAASEASAVPDWVALAARAGYTADGTNYETIINSRQGSANETVAGWGEC